jgi:LysM repeat protein
VIVVIATTLGGGGGGGSSNGSSNRASHSHPAEGPAHVPQSYVVKNGDTLSSIAHQTGVPVATIIKLNPGVDPQILVSGERLKLK